MSRIVFDIECNSLDSPDKIWVIACRDIDTGELHVFRNVTEIPSERLRFLAYASGVQLWVGHNCIEFDLPHLARLIDLAIDPASQRVVDTLIVSRLVNYSNPRGPGPGRQRSGSVGDSAGLVSDDDGPYSRVAQGHSVEAYGLEFGYEKLKFDDFSKYSEEMETYCIRDVDICLRIYNKYKAYIEEPEWWPSIELEHQFQYVINALHDRGFYFNKSKAEKLLEKVTAELKELDSEIEIAFPPRLALIREINPKVTKYGTLSRTDFRWVSGGDLSEFNGGPFCHCKWERFNPASHKQVISTLRASGWSPIDRTQAHIDCEREINRIKFLKKEGDLDIRLKELYIKLEGLKKTGWKINENNLSTLPSTAPAPSRLLAKRILLESRRRTLTEWLDLVGSDGRIHGRFYGIGAWTHRMAHQEPNTANIPNDLDTSGKKKLLGKEMRALWCAPKNRLLVGVDAEGIQLRIFAHYIDDPEFTKALMEGRKDDKTDPHSLNQRILGGVCKTRAAAKRFIFALLLGAGIWKLSQILECSEPECKEALGRLLERYAGWKALRETSIPRDARRGYFDGLDGRKVLIPGGSLGERKHLTMSGYLQNGEAVVMKKATVKFFPNLPAFDAGLVNFVHDEWQTETPNKMKIALQVAEMKAKALEEAGVELGLKCPMKGSYWNEDLKDYTIGTNWSVTH